MTNTSALAAITGGSVYAPAPLGTVDLLMGGTKILAIGAGLAQSLTTSMPDIEIINAEGQIVTPGLIDGHFHPLGGGDLSGPVERRSDVIEMELLRCGVTSGVGVLAADTTGRTLAGLSLKSAQLAASGFSLYWYAGSVADPDANLTGSVESDVTHLPKCPGVKLAISEPMCSTTAEEMATAAVAAIRGARMAGKQGVVHLHVGSADSGLAPLYDLLERTGLPAANFQPTHVNRSERLIAQAAAFLQARGTVDLTATLPLGGGSRPALDLKSGFEMLMKMGARLDQVTFSSDGNVTISQYDENEHFRGWPKPGVHALLEAWRGFARESGLPFEDALKPVTANPARVLGLQGCKGCIREGADADLVLWADDLRPDLVISAGNIVFPHSNPRNQSTIENAAG